MLTKESDHAKDLRAESSDHPCRLISRGRCRVHRQVIPEVEVVHGDDTIQNTNFACAPG